MTNIIQFPAPAPDWRIGGRQAVECATCDRYIVSNAATLAGFRESLRTRGWWSDGHCDLCDECLDSAPCPDCGHHNCDRYWTYRELRQERCTCHAAIELLDRRLARALEDLEIPAPWTPGTPLPTLPA